MARAKDSPKKAVIYARTSSDDGDLKRQRKLAGNGSPGPISHKESVKEQIELCQARADKMGYEVVGTFWDQNISGRTYPLGHAIDDPAFDGYFDEHIKRRSKRHRRYLGQLLDLSDIDVILVRDVYRLIRPAFQSHLGNHIWQILTRRKIKIHSASDGEIDSSKFEDIMLTNLKLQLADQAKQQEIAAARRSLRAKKDGGYLASGVKCFGFRSSGHQQVRGIAKELKAVRLIYDRYLAGVKMLQIGTELNDAMNVANFSGRKKSWNVQQIRCVLLRPWYCGLQLNSQGELIESKVFPTGDAAVVSKDEYLKVVASFEKRKRLITRTDADIERQRKQETEGRPLRGGSRMGIEQTNGVLHPLTGLVKCGCCGKNLYVTTNVNFYYSDKIPVTTYSYICKTPQTTKAPEFDDCRKMRIIEHYPEKALEFNVKPNGLGLMEALFPLLFRGYIGRYIEQVTVAPKLHERRATIQFQLEQVTSYEGELFRKLDEKDIDDEQFGLGMKRHRDKKTKLRDDLKATEDEIAHLASGGVHVPREVFEDPDKMPRDVMRELAHEAFEEILVFPDKIRVRLKLSKDTVRPGTPECIDIPRVRRRNARNLPFWKARISTPEIAPDTKLGVTYYLKSTDAGKYNQVQLVYHDKNMEVLLVGTNESVDKKRSTAEEAPELVNEIIKFAFGPPPGYDRILEVNKDASMAKWIVPMKDMYPAEALVEAFPHLGPIPEEADAERKETLSITPPDALMDIPGGPLKR